MMTDAQERSTAAYLLGLSLSKVFGGHETAWLGRDEGCSDEVIEQLEELKGAAGELEGEGSVARHAENARNLWEHLRGNKTHICCSTAYRLFKRWAEPFINCGGPSDQPGVDSQNVTSFSTELIVEILASAEISTEREDVREHVKDLLEEKLEQKSSLSWDSLEEVLVRAGLISTPDSLSAQSTRIIEERLRRSWTHLARIFRKSAQIM